MEKKKESEEEKQGKTEEDTTAVPSTPAEITWNCLCGNTNKSRFCIQCGRKREWMCPKCKVERTTLYCIKCGTKRKG